MPENEKTVQAIVQSSIATKRYSRQFVGTQARRQKGRTVLGVVADNQKETVIVSKVCLLWHQQD